MYGEVKVKDDLLSGYPLYSQIMPLLDSGTINPFGPTSDPGALAAAKATEFTGQDFSTKTSITSLGATGSRQLLALPAGPLSAAVGGELRRETFNYNPPQQPSREVTSPVRAEISCRNPRRALLRRASWSSTRQS